MISQKGPCGHCGTSSSPVWRKGNLDLPVLCNACAVHLKRTGNLLGYMPKVPINQLGQSYGKKIHKKNIDHSQNESPLIPDTPSLNVKVKTYSQQSNEVDIDETNIDTFGCEMLADNKLLNEAKTPESIHNKHYTNLDRSFKLHKKPKNLFVNTDCSQQDQYMQRKYQGKNLVLSQSDDIVCGQVQFSDQPMTNLFIFVRNKSRKQLQPRRAPEY